MQEGILKIDSCVRADKIYTLSQNLAVKWFGKVGPEVVEKVKARVLDVMGGQPVTG